MRRDAALLFGLVLVGSIGIAYPTSSPAMTVATVEVPFGALASGSTVGLNMTNASASIAGAVVLATTVNVLYINNTNATGAYHVKLVQTGATGLAGSTVFNLGVTSDGVSTDQIKSANGAITQSSGSYVQLQPGSTNQIYATTLVPVIFGSGTITFDAYVADDAAESAFYVMKGQVTMT